MPLAAVASPEPARAANVLLAATRGTPPEITAFLRRRAGCNRLAGQDGEDPDHVADTVRSRFWMKCNNVEEDERRLRARYANSPNVIAALDQDGDTDNSDD